MNRGIGWVFQREVSQQSRFAMIAINDLKEALSSNSRDSMDRVWYCIQAFLIATANISKILWPSEACDKARGSELRRMFSVGENSPLKKRRFRNHFEHFDERLERYAESTGMSGISDGNIGLRLHEKHADPKSCFRNFEPSSAILTFQGEIYELEPIIDAVEELLERTGEGIYIDDE